MKDTNLISNEQLMKVSGGAENNAFDEATKLLKEAGDRAFVVGRDPLSRVGYNMLWGRINEAENETSPSRRSAHIKGALSALKNHSNLRPDDYNYIYERLIKSAELTKKCK